MRNVMSIQCAPQNSNRKSNNAHHPAAAHKHAKEHTGIDACLSRAQQPRHNVQSKLMRSDIDITLTGKTAETDQSAADIISMHNGGVG
jgi:hypothetical protein